MNKVHSHYDNLRVTRNAPPSIIRAAYRTLSQQYHPDKSTDPDAERIMTILNNSYEVLSDPERRRRHDNWIAQQEGVAPQAAPRPVASDENSTTQAPPRTAAGARAASAQRRESPMPQTIFFWPLVFRMLRQIPWTIWAVVLVVAFLVWWPFKLGAPGTEWASNQYGDATQKRVDELLAAKPEEAPAATAIPAAAQAAPAVSPLMRAPNGEEWPHIADYVPGYEVSGSGGNSTLTIDNTSNGYDVYVKLAWANAAPGTALRHVYIPRRGMFTMEGVVPGSYEVRYKDLSSGSVAKTEPFALDEEQTASGVRFSQVTFTLYTVQHGNTKMQHLSADQF